VVQDVQLEEATKEKKPAPQLVHELTSNAPDVAKNFPEKQLVQTLDATLAE